MIEYAIKDINDNEYKLNGATISSLPKESLTFITDDIDFESDIEEKTGSDGAIQLNVPRIKSKDITFEIKQIFKTMSEFRTATNELCKNCNKAISLLDNTNSLLTSIAIKNIAISYLNGAHKISANIEITFALLQPYWEHFTYEEINESLSADINDISINNEGFIETPPIITLTTSVATEEIEIYIAENSEGMKIEDSLFGTVGYEEMIIDCKEGTIKLGSTDIISSLVPGTGFFKLPIGENTLRIIPSEPCTVKIEYKELEFV